MKERRTIKEEIEEVKKQPQRILYIPPDRAEEWVKMRRDLGRGTGAKIMDIYREWKDN